MSTDGFQTTGSCACGAIQYEAKNVAPVWFCHCRQCRYMTGHYMAASQVQLSDIKISGEPKWHYISERARHGFCPDCGSQMFWRNDEKQHLSVTGGSMHNTAGLTNKGHIFIDEKGDYYQLRDDEKQCEQWGDDG